MRRKIVAFTLVLALLTGALSANMAQSPAVLAQDTPSSVEDYDFNSNGIIDLDEAIAAVDDCLVYGTIDCELAHEVMDAFLSGEEIERPTLFVRIVMDSLYCYDESDWDHGTNSDEPYLVVGGTATFLEEEESAWGTGDCKVFNDVDDWEVRRWTAKPEDKQRLIYEGEVPPHGELPSVLGFHAILMEQDGWTGEQHRKLTDRFAQEVSKEVKKKVQEEVVKWLATGGAAAGGAAGGAIVGATLGTIMGAAVGAGVGIAVGAVLGWAIGELSYHAAGGEDDVVAYNTVSLSYDELLEWSTQSKYRIMELNLDGGDNGHYYLRWHIEFDPEFSYDFEHVFSKWDEFDVGNVYDLTSEDEIVVVIDDHASGTNGRFYILHGTNGALLTHFDAFYSKWDRVAIGDVLGDAKEEIVVASDDGGGWIRIYDETGYRIFEFSPERFSHHDELAIGNVMGDSKEEILLAVDDSDQVWIYDGNGNQANILLLDWNLRGCRYTAEESRHDAFMVGDVLGDSHDEIVIVEKRPHETRGIVRVYDGFSLDLLDWREVFFSNNDGAVLADLSGDSKKELVIARDDFYILDIYDMSRMFFIGERYWPCFTKYDGFAAGDVFGAGNDQILVATDEDDWVYITK